MRYTDGPNQPIRQAWASVLGVPPGDLMFHIDGLMRLFEATRVAYEDLGDPSWSGLPQHLTELAEAVLPLGVAWSQQKSQALPNTTAMAYLLAFSSHLHHVASEGALPAAEALDDLRTDVRQLIQSLAEANLEPQIKRILISRVADVLEALEHLDVHGADGVRKAIEALGLSAAWYDEAAADKSAMDRVKGVVKKAVTLFSISVVTAGGLVTLDTAEQRIDHILNPPYIHQRQLPPPEATPEAGRPQLPAP
jgi:hypothetical protein